MVDARLPGRWLMERRMRAMSRGAWSLFTTALMFCNEQLTDGVIFKEELRLLHQEPTEAECDELERLGLWHRDGPRFVFTDWDKGLGQTTSEAFLGERERKRKNQADKRERERTKAEKAAAVQPHVTDRVTGDMGGDVGEERRGKDRKGDVSKATRFPSNVVPFTATPKPVTSWSVAKVPGEEFIPDSELEAF